MGNPLKTARTAGLFYLLCAIFGGFSQLYVRGKVLVPGDAAATANNVREWASLVRIAYGADLAAFTFFLLVALVLYPLLKPVSEPMALAMVVLNAVSVAIQCLNMLNHAAALMIATNPVYSGGAGSLLTDARVLFFLDLHARGYAIAQIFYGMWLLPLGYLIFKSGFFPRRLGALVIVGGFSYMTGVVAAFLFPGLGNVAHTIIATPAGLAELTLCLWLLVKGVRVHRPLPA